MAGSPSAQFNLNLLYTFGWGISKNESEALRWLRVSADQHYPPAMYALASRYGSGNGVAQDSSKSLQLLVDAADQGFLLAQMLLGNAYETGYRHLEIRQDINLATDYYRKAAAQCKACQYELWRIYYFGIGVDKDPVIAARHLEKSANAGLARAQMQLAFRYIQGDGVAPDNTQAYKWFYLAGQGNDPTAGKALPLLSREMSKSEISIAETMAETSLQTIIINTRQLCDIYQQFCDL